MGTPPKPRLRRAIAILLAAALSSGCASAVRTGLAIAGVRSPGDVQAPATAPLTRPKPAPRTTSTYEHTPRITWQGFTTSGPYHPNYSMFDRLGWNSCTIQPQGVSRVIPVANGPPAMPLYALGPLEIGAAGIPALEARSLFSGDAQDLSTRLMERTSRNATLDAGCGHRVFFYLGLAGSAGSTPVLVSR